MYQTFRSSPLFYLLSVIVLITLTITASLLSNIQIRIALFHIRVMYLAIFINLCSCQISSSPC